MTPAAKLIAACDGCPATAQALVLDTIMATLAVLGDDALLKQAEANLLANMRQHCQPNTLGAVQYLMEMRERTKRQVEGNIAEDIKLLLADGMLTDQEERE
jgi:hypothetical protein